MSKDIKIQAIKYYINKYYDEHIRHPRLRLLLLGKVESCMVATALYHPTSIQVYIVTWGLFDLLPLEEEGLDYLLEQLCPNFDVDMFQLQQELQCPTT